MWRSSAALSRQNRLACRPRKRFTSPPSGDAAPRGRRTRGCRCLRRTRFQAQQGAKDPGCWCGNSNIGSHKMFGRSCARSFLFGRNYSSLNHFSELNFSSSSVRFRGCHFLRPIDYCFVYIKFQSIKTFGNATFSYCFEFKPFYLSRSTFFPSSARFICIFLCLRSWATLASTLGHSSVWNCPPQRAMAEPDERPSCRRQRARCFFQNDFQTCFE